MVTKELLSQVKTNKDENLFDLSHERPVLLIFLRHIGCIFCQEALKDIKNQKSDIQDMNVKIILVHLASSAEGQRFFEEFGLGDLDHISDETCKLYEDFGLIKTNRRELFGFQVLLKSAESSVIRGNWPRASRIGDGFQMPGVFILENGIVKDSYVHQRISDRPNYIKLASCCRL